MARFSVGRGPRDLRIVDVRGVVLPPGNRPRYLPKRGDYDAAHIPGAVFVDWTRDIVDPDDPVPVQIARPEAFAAKMSELGIGDETLVVAYDDYNHIFAGRLAWALRFYGHDDVRILDGGWSRWLAEHRPTTQDNGSLSRAIFTPRPRVALRRSADDVARILGRRDVLLIDARPPDQYAGSTSAAARTGHIPGARNVPYARLVDPSTQRFLGREAIAQVFADAGIDPAEPTEIVVYCNGGFLHRAAARTDDPWARKRGSLRRFLERMGERRGAACGNGHPLATVNRATDSRNDDKIVAKNTSLRP